MDKVMICNHCALNGLAIVELSTLPASHQNQASDIDKRFGQKQRDNSQTMNTKELIDRIFKEPGVKFELTEFENLGKPIHEILTIYPKTASTGKDAGKIKFYLKSFIPFSTGNEEVQVYAEGGKSAPEEIIRQLWVYKLIHQYGYQADGIDR